MPDVFNTSLASVTVDLAGEVRVWASDGQRKHMTALVSPQAWSVLRSYAERLRDERLGVWRSSLPGATHFVVYGNVAPTLNPERILVFDEVAGKGTYFEGMPAAGDVFRTEAKVARLYYLAAQVPGTEPAIQGLTQEVLDGMKEASS